MRIRVALAAAGLLLSGCGFASGPQYQSISDFYEQDLVWRGCEESFKCTELTVPLDYKDPSGKVIQLAVMKHPAAGKSKGALLANPGGPGGSGLDYLSSYDLQFTAQLVNNFDLVSWDPRGVGGSAPVVCTDDAELDAYLAVDNTPDTAAEVKALASSQKSFDQQCLDHSGDLLSHISTTETVQDLDILRAALHEDKLNYLGKSYGTTIGAVYAHLFPERVGRFVLDGAVDASLDSLDTTLGQAVGFEDALHRFARYCLTLGKDCGIGDTEQDIINRISKLMVALDKKPLPAMDDRVLTESLAWTAVVGPLYVPDGGWDWLIEGLRYAYDGDGAMLLDITDWFNNRDYDGTYLDNATEAFVAISCLDNGPQRRDPEKFAAEFAAAAPTFGRSFAWGEALCNGWPAHGEELTRDVSAPTAPPIVVIGTTHDPATPDAWAKALANELGVGVYINYDGDGHTAYMSGSETLDSAVDDYFLNGVVPVAGTSYAPGNQV